MSEVEKPDWSKLPRSCQVRGCTVTRPLDEMIHGHVVVSAPGHGSIPPFQCYYEEHWGCSIDHFIQIQHECLDSHISLMLTQVHSVIPDSVHKP